MSNQEGINVLSLFDGMSCAQLALQKAGVKVNQYFASEIDNYAMKVTQKNFPDTIQLGDVTKVNVADLPRIDVLMGGSPCQAIPHARKWFHNRCNCLYTKFYEIITTMNNQKDDLFSGIAFHVHKIPFTKNVLKELPKLGLSIKAFLEYRHLELDTNKVIRAVIYAFDKKSGLLDIYPNVEERRKKACMYAGLDEDDVDWSDEATQKLALAYLYFQSDRRFIMLNSYENQFFSIQKMLTAITLDTRDDKAKTEALIKMQELSKSAEFYIDRIENLYNEIFGENKDIKSLELKKRESDFQESIAEEIARLAN